MASITIEKIGSSIQVATDDNTNPLGGSFLKMTRPMGIAQVSLDANQNFVNLTFGSFESLQFNYNSGDTYSVGGVQSFADNNALYAQIVNTIS